MTTFITLTDCNRDRTIMLRGDCTDRHSIRHLSRFMKAHGLYVTAIHQVDYDDVTLAQNWFSAAVG